MTLLYRGVSTPSALGLVKASSDFDFLVRQIMLDHKESTTGLFTEMLRAYMVARLLARLPLLASSLLSALSVGSGRRNTAEFGRVPVPGEFSSAPPVARPSLAVEGTEAVVGSGLSACVRSSPGTAQRVNYPMQDPTG